MSLLINWVSLLGTEPWYILLAIIWAQAMCTIRSMCNTHRIETISPGGFTSGQLRSSLWHHRIQGNFSFRHLGIFMKTVHTSLHISWFRFHRFDIDRQAKSPGICPYPGSTIVVHKNWRLWHANTVMRLSRISHSAKCPRFCQTGYSVDIRSMPSA